MEKGNLEKVDIEIGEVEKDVTNHHDKANSWTKVMGSDVEKVEEISECSIQIPSFVFVSLYYQILST